jgi:hypothetical protein
MSDKMAFLLLSPNTWILQTKGKACNKRVGAQRQKSCCLKKKQCSAIFIKHLSSAL